MQSARPGIGRFAALWCAVAGIAAAPAWADDAGALEAASDAPAVIEGQMFDREGRPLRGRTVVLLEVRTTMSLPFSEKKTTETIVRSAESDVHGLFRMELPLEGRHGKLYVRCYDRDAWDHVRHAVPDDIEVTHDAYESLHAIVSCAIDDAAAWTEIVREITRAGGTKTKQGSILRTHGLPPEIRTDPDGRERWVYAHVEYLFDDGRLVETIERSGLEARPDSPS